MSKINSKLKYSTGLFQESSTRILLFGQRSQKIWVLTVQDLPLQIT